MPENLTSWRHKFFTRQHKYFCVFCFWMNEAQRILFRINILSLGLTNTSCFQAQTERFNLWLQRYCTLHTVQTTVPLQYI